MATGGVIKGSQDCSLVVTDGAALTWNSENLFTGEITISNMNRKMRGITIAQARGLFIGARSGEFEPIEFTLTFHFANYSGTVTAGGNTETENPQDVFGKTGTWAAATSTLGAAYGGSDVHAVDIQVKIEGTDLGDGADHTMTFTKCIPRVELAIEAAPGTWSIPIQCVGPTSGDVTITNA